MFYSIFMMASISIYIRNTDYETCKKKIPLTDVLYFFNDTILYRNYYNKKKKSDHKTDL